MKAQKHISALLITLLTVSAMSGMAPPVYADEAPSLSYDGYTEVWAEEFDGNELNRNDWNVELHNPGWVNSELQAYVDSEDNIRVEDGMLYLIPREQTKEMDAGANLLKNADFSNGKNSWTETIANWDNPPLAEASSSIQDGSIRYNITNPGTEDWHVQLKQEGISLSPGTYHVSFKASSTVDRSIKVVMMSASYAWYGGLDEVNLTGTPSEYSFDFTMDSEDPTAQLAFSMGKTGADAPPASTITISDISLSSDAPAGTVVTGYTSGRINTQNKQTFTYGLFEVRAKVPEGQGYLPAFWLMANDENAYGQWPRCGEIDCMEVMGQDTQKLYGTIHYGNPHAESQGTYVLSGADSFSSDFHTFSCEWLPGEIRWYVDGNLYHSEQDWYSTTEGQGTLTYPAPFDQPFYIILNLAVGGSWVGNPDENTSFDNNPYVVDYVRVYQKDSYDEDVTRPEKEFSPRDPDEEGNYIVNGTFDDAESLTDDENWKFMTANGGVANAVIEDGRMHITTIEQGSVDYSVQLVQANIPLEKGATYQVSFDASADEYRTMNVDIKAPDHGYQSYMPTQTPEMNSETRTYTYDFVMQSNSDENARLEFNMGAMGFDSPIRLDNVVVKKIADPDPNAKETKTVLANGNYIYNGSFQEGPGKLGYWTLSDDTAASVTDFSDGRRLKVTKELTLTQEDLTFQEGAPYALSFEAEGEGSITVTVGGQEFTAQLTGSKQEYRFKLPASLSYADQTVSVSFPGNGTVYFDNIMLAEDALIKNGSFNNGLTAYEVYVDSSANASYVVDSLNEDNALDVTVNNTGDQDWKVQIKQNNVPLEKGQTYTLQFKAKSDMERTIRVVMQGQENRGWAVYSSDNMVTLGSEFQTFTDTFTMNEDTDLNAFLSICLGNVDEQITTQHRVVIDDISLTMEEAPTPTPTPTPSPKPTPTPAPTYKFSDVQNPKHAYFNAIYWAADAGITKGYPDGTFGIDKPCTRGEMMMFLWRYAGKPAPKTVSKSPFKDVPKTHTFYKAILWGSQKGITKGYSDGTFGLNRNVSRGECMMFLWRLKGKPAPKTVAKSPFKDVSKTHTFYKAILWGSQKKVTTGYTSGAKKGTFGINENCTRGQIVTFLYRAK